MYTDDRHKSLCETALVCGLALGRSTRRQSRRGTSTAGVGGGPSPEHPSQSPSTTSLGSQSPSGTPEETAPEDREPPPGTAGVLCC